MKWIAGNEKMPGILVPAKYKDSGYELTGVLYPTEDGYEFDSRGTRITIINRSVVIWLDEPLPQINRCNRQAANEKAKELARKISSNQCVSPSPSLQEAAEVVGGFYVRILAESNNKKYVADCDRCGWIGSSALLNISKGHPESGCSGDVHCPICDNPEVSENEKLIPIPEYIERLAKAHKMLREFKDKYEGIETGKYISRYLEEQLKEAQMEIDSLRAQQTGVIQQEVINSSNPILRPEDALKRNPPECHAYFILINKDGNQYPAVANYSTSSQWTLPQGFSKEAGDYVEIWYNPYWNPYAAQTGVFLTRELYDKIWEAAIRYDRCGHAIEFPDRETFFTSLNL